MSKITYMPTPHDPDETVVAGVTFKAYEETSVADPELAARLRTNPWFTDDVVDEARHTAWASVRAAQAKLQETREEAEHLAAYP